VGRTGESTEPIFAKSSRPLTDWFYVMFMVASSRCGVAAKQVERELGVNYKTAWRMLNKVRTELMAQDDTPLSGEVEADETYVGGKPRQSERNKLYREGTVAQRGRDYGKHTIVFGAVERGGSVVAKVIPNSGGILLRETVSTHVLPGSILFTDDYGGYRTLSGKYQHRRINHSAKVYVSGTTHTQTIEGFFSHFKNDVRGTHHAISKRWLNSYLNEWVWKWNHRKDGHAMFHQLISLAAGE
jgi:hypothetical protein